jgi:homoserine dehydrogenase
MINVAILGYGVVGSGVAQVCDMNKDSITKKVGKQIYIKKILDIRDFPGDPFEDRLTKNADDVFNDPDISVVVETIGGINIAYEFTLRALNAGKSVITSNKELVATHGPKILALAHEKRLSYLFEASVGGGIPIIRPLIKCLSADRVNAIYGILNGTTNYILTKMERENVSFENALEQAQKLGFAEQNPTSDIEGLDTCRKIAILSSIATGEFIDYRQIYTEGIKKITDRDIQYAHHLGFKIKLIAMAKLADDNIIETIVTPAFLSSENPLTVANDEFNAILVEGNALGPAMFYGKGAGKMATASAVMADVIEAVLHINLTPHMLIWEQTKSVKVKNHDDCYVKAFIRLEDGEPARQIINQFEICTDITFLQKEFDGEIAVLVGRITPITEKKLFGILGQSPACLSVIRIL